MNLKLCIHEFTPKQYRRFLAIAKLFQRNQIYKCNSIAEESWRMSIWQHKNNRIEENLKSKKEIFFRHSNAAHFFFLLLSARSTQSSTWIVIFVCVALSYLIFDSIVQDEMLTIFHHMKKNRIRLSIPNQINSKPKPKNQHNAMDNERKLLEWYN